MVLGNSEKLYRKGEIWGQVVYYSFINLCIHSTSVY